MVVSPGGPGFGGEAGEAGSGGTSEGATPESPVYLKASNAGAGDLFGVAVALSADGSTLAVGANREASGARGIDGDQSDDSLADAGAVYVFARIEGSWQQRAYLKASNSGMGDAFGSSLALSADGSTLAVGAPFEASSATGIDGEQNDDSLPDAGAVYVFSRSGDRWQQEAYVKASNTGDDDLFGISLSLSADGSVLAVGAEGEDSLTTGIDGDQSDKSWRDAGAVYVFARNAGSWQQVSYIKASNTDRADHFGGAVSLAADGRTLAVGAYFEDSAGSGIDGDQANNAAESAGAVYLFVHDGSTWEQAAYLKPAENDGNGFDGFGSSVSLAADGSALAVGAAGDDSAATGVDGDPNDTSMPYAGAAYLFGKDGAVWQQRAYLKATYPGAGDEFGHHVSLSQDGTLLAVGAALEGSSGVGIGALRSDDGAPSSGAVTLFGNDDNLWGERVFIKAPNPGAGDRFGWSVALGGGDVLVVGASREASAVAGVNGDQSDDAAAQAGAVYVYGAFGQR